MEVEERWRWRDIEFGDRCGNRRPSVYFLNEIEMKREWENERAGEGGEMKRRKHAIVFEKSRKYETILEVSYNCNKYMKCGKCDTYPYFFFVPICFILLFCSC